MHILEKLAGLQLPDDTVVTLTYSEGTDVFVHNETEVETAIADTDVISSFAELIATSGLKVTTPYGSEVLQSLRDEGLLEDYDREGWFGEYLCETINDNFYDIDLIEHSTEKYDHKRGYCTLTATVKANLDNLLEAQPYLGGWTASVSTVAGTLTLE
jgi:hypothetical protein